jgi:Major intrinsic protein
MSHNPEQQPLLPPSSSSNTAAADMAKSFNVGSRTSRAIAAAEAEEGPFPSPLKTMLLAEAFGTCLFVQMGGAAQCVGLYVMSSASAASSSSSKSSSSIMTPSSSFFPVAIVWGLALALSVYLTAAQSGAHLNPAVSFSFALVRPSDFRFRKMVPYFVVQVLAGVLAATINLFLFHEAIATYESKHRLVRGSTQSIASASAFANYYRCVQRLLLAGSPGGTTNARWEFERRHATVPHTHSLYSFHCAACIPMRSATLRTRSSSKDSGRPCWCSACSA